MEQKLTVSMIIAMVAATSSAAPLVTFIFGDSLTEVGNNNYLQLSLAKSNYPHYGIDFEGGKATGRFTNGKTIGDIICKLLNQTIFYSHICIQFDMALQYQHKLLVPC